MVFEVVGWIGTGLLVLAYGYLNAAKRPLARLYFSMNCAASLAVAASSAWYTTWQSVAINGAWAAISLLALVRRRAAVFRVDWRLMPASVAVLTFAALILLTMSEGQAAVVVLGWSSPVAFVFAYLLFSTRQVSARCFHGFNLYAAMALMPQLMADRNWPVLGLESCWVLFAAWGLWRAGEADLAEPV